MRGEKTPGSGRQRGTPNKSTAEVKALAQEHGPDAIQFFVDVMNDDQQPIQARHLAAKELLDRGYGRPSVELSLHVQQATSAPLYFGWVPRDRLAQIRSWLAEARVAYEAGAPRPADPVPLLEATDGVLVEDGTESKAVDAQG